MRLVGLCWMFTIVYNCTDLCFEIYFLTSSNVLGISWARKTHFHFLPWIQWHAEDWTKRTDISANLELRRSVRSCSHTIPEKVRNSRPINMGLKGWGWLLWESWVTFKLFRYKKFNEWAQTANSSVFSRLRQELCAENPQNMEYEGN